MSTNRKTGKSGGARAPGTAHDTASAHGEPLKNALGLWRTMPADGFAQAQRDAVADCMRRTSSTVAIWRAAIRGDATSPIALLLQHDRLPARITARTDLMMTALLNCALNGSAGAAPVLSHALRKMPLETPKRNRLATSWLADNLRRALPGPGGVAGHRPGRASPPRPEEQS